MPFFLSLLSLLLLLCPSIHPSIHPHTDVFRVFCEKLSSSFSLTSKPKNEHALLYRRLLISKLEPPRTQKLNKRSSKNQKASVSSSLLPSIRCVFVIGGGKNAMRNILTFFFLMQRIFDMKYLYTRKCAEFVHCCEHDRHLLTTRAIIITERARGEEIYRPIYISPAIRSNFL